MTTDLHATRRSIASRVNKILSDYGVENAVSGGKYPDLRQKIDPTTGYWADRTVISKPPRLIIHFRKRADSLEVKLPPANTNGNFAYANTARRSVGGLFVRILPVIELGETHFAPHPEWEWILWYCFWPELRNGSSGQLFYDFDPENGRFTYMGQIQPYIAAGLVTLNAPEAEFLHPSTNSALFTYGDATAGLRNFIRMAPSSPGSSRVEE